MINISIINELENKLEELRKNSYSFRFVADCDKKTAKESEAKAQLAEQKYLRFAEFVKNYKEGE